MPESALARRTARSVVFWFLLGVWFRGALSLARSRSLSLSLSLALSLSLYLSLSLSLSLYIIYIYIYIYILYAHPPPHDRPLRGRGRVVSVPMHDLPTDGRQSPLPNSIPQFPNFQHSPQPFFPKFLSFPPNVTDRLCQMGHRF